jgi:Na+-transporting methylmalonyl-CoA/oxaloacetate decarboxylase gamma subunit
MGHVWFNAVATSVLSGLFLAILLGVVRMGLLVRDTVRESKTLTNAVAELRKDHSDDHERLTAVEAALAWRVHGGRHRTEGQRYGYW